MAAPFASNVSPKVVSTFRRFDNNGDGTIDRQELREVFQRLDPTVWSDARLDQIMEEADVNKDSKIDIEEFVAWIFSGNEQADARSALELDSWKEFGNLKVGFDLYADEYGYVHLTNEEAVSSLGRFLGLDADVVKSEMGEADVDKNGIVGFGEFALWADKNTQGVPLGIAVPDKRDWQKGMPSYWTSVLDPDEGTFRAMPEEADTSELEDLTGAAKAKDWDQAFAILRRRPGYIDMRPEHRFFATIHQAAIQGNMEVLRRLVDEYGANPSLPAKNGRTPEYVAAKENHIEAAEYLRSACAKFFPSTPSSPSSPPKIRRSGKKSEYVSKKDVQDANTIIEKAKWGKFDEMLELLTATPKAINIRPHFRRFAAIHQVAYAGEADVLRRIVEEFKADPQLPTKDGKTPLEVATGRSKTEASEYLASLEPAGEEARVQDAHAIIDAAKRNQPSLLFELLDKAPDLVNVRPEVRVYGALHQIAYHGDVAVLQRLISDYRADVNQLTGDGKTALQIAEDHGQEAAVEYLQAANPTISLEDDYISYPAQTFVKVADEGVLELFRQLCEKTHKTDHNWTRDRMGASGTYDPHTPVPTGYKFVGALRNEHPAMWRIYQISREIIRLDCLEPKKDKDPFSAWSPQTMEGDGLDWSSHDLCAEANEWVLFHASRPEALNAIARTGFTMQKVGLGATTGGGGLYGDGTYFTDSITKSDEYARAKVEGSEFDGCRTVALVRVVGGRHYYTDQDVSDEDKPEFQRRVIRGSYHSTVGDRLKLKNTFREYVAYDAACTYLEYILHFRRLGVPPEHE